MNVVRKSLCIGTVLTLLCVCASAALAVDSFVPSWRGSAGSTYQEWGFDNESDPTSPTAVSNIYGTPTAAVTIGDFGSGWFAQLPGMGNANNYYDLGGSGGTINLNINTCPAPVDYTDVWVRVTYYVDMSQAPDLSIQTTGTASLVSEETSTVEQVDTGGAWIAKLSKWRVDPNSGSIGVTVTSNPMWGSVIDGISVDTVAPAVPEPSSLAGLLVGASALLGLRRRRATTA